MLLRTFAVLLACVSALCGATAPQAALDPAGPGTWTSEDGKLKISYVFAPPAHPQPGARLAVVFGFHGNNGDAQQEIPSTSATLEAMKIRDQYLIVGLKSAGMGWNESDDETVLAFMHYALKRWPVDPRRVYGVGFSGGSFFLNRFVPLHSDLFAGAVTWVGGGGADPIGAPADCGARYWINGGKDTTVSAASCRPQALAAKAKGTPVVYREPRSLAHQFAVEPVQTDAIAWLDRLRNAAVAPAGADAEFIAMLAGEKGAKALEKPATWERLLAIGGRAAQPAIAAGLASESVPVRLNAATLCARMVVDAAGIEALAALLDAKDQRLRSAAIEALATQTSWQQPGAGAALRRAALAHERKLPERGAVVTALTRVAALDLTGGYQSPEVAWTLVDLLDDDSPALRQVAFSALAPAETGGFGYDAKAAAEPRKATAAKWAEWCARGYGERPNDPSTH